MKKYFLALCFLFSLILGVSAGDSDVSYGIHVLAGGRYDDLRMCVGSPAGIKGGPIMDVYFDIIIPAGTQGQVIMNIPVARPILFGAAFKMLQFEPQVTYEYRLPLDGGDSLVLGGGLGMAFHYGPDFESSPDDRGEDFFAMGPLFSLSAGYEFLRPAGSWRPGVKLFYSPLVLSEMANGTVLGGGMELYYHF